MAKYLRDNRIQVQRNLQKINIVLPQRRFGGRSAIQRRFSEDTEAINRPMKKAHLLRCASIDSLQRTAEVRLRLRRLLARLGSGTFLIGLKKGGSIEDRNFGSQPAFVFFLRSLGSAHQIDRWLRFNQLSAVSCLDGQRSGNISQKRFGCRAGFFQRKHHGGDGPASKGNPDNPGDWSTVVSASLRGSDAVMIAGGYVLADYWLMSRSDMKTAEQLKGGTVAVSTFGGQSEFVARIALKKLGLTPGKDVTMVQIGAPPDRLIALQTGKVRAALLNPPDSFVGEKRAFTL